MQNFSVPMPVRATSPEGLYLEVMKYITAGFDLHSPTAVLGGELVTWLAPYPSEFIYVLVYKPTLEEYFAEVQKYSEKGYDQVFASFEFDGLKCQWMAKVHSRHEVEVEPASAFAKPVLVAEALASLKAFNLVESVQKLSSFQFLPGDAQ
jgi:hypothetical protein